MHLQVAGRDDEGLHYTVSVDLYSAGVAMCELAARHLLVDVEGSVPSPSHPDADYTSASSMIRDGLAVLRSLPGALATGASAVAAIAATQQRLVGGVEGTRVAVPRDVRFLLEAGVDSLFSQIR